MSIRLIIIIFFVSSCGFKKNMTYLKDFEEKEYLLERSNIYHDNTIKIDQKLNISIMHSEEDLNNSSVNAQVESLKFLSRYVDKNGYVKVPIIGKMYAKGLTTSEFESVIREKLMSDNILLDPTVNIIITNFKFTILGEVTSPGTHYIDDKKINIFQAIGISGDLTLDAKRDKIKIIRNKDSSTITKYINLNDESIFNSEMFFVHNNDVIIVDPSFSKVKATGFIGSPQSISSIASLILSITLILIN